MSNRRCPRCGEEYSDTYRSCPFCEEEAALKRGKALHRRGGRRAEKRQPSGGAGGVMLLVSGIIILFVLGYVFFGDNLAGVVGIRDNPDPAPVGSEADTPPGHSDPTPPAQDEPDSNQSGNGEPVVVEPDISPDPPVEPAGPLALSQSDITIPSGETGLLIATGGSGEISWTSSNPEIASVENGSVTGVAGGTVTITATSGEETATCQVTVEGEPWVNPNASSYSLNREDFTLTESSPTFQMKVRGTDSPAVWAIENTNVATVSETGLVTRVGRGSTTLTATVDGVTLTCIVRG